MTRQPLHKPLGHPGAVAYLVAHAEKLTAQGVFKGRQAARTVFLYFCLHPGANAPGLTRKPGGGARSSVTRHHKPGAIAEATGLDVITSAAQSTG